MDYAYWVGIAIIISFVSYVVVDSVITLFDYLVGIEND